MLLYLIFKLEIPELKLFSREAFDAISEGTTSNDVVKELKEIIQDVNSQNAQYLDGFITDDKLLSWSKRLDKNLINSPEICSGANNKLKLHHFLQKEGLPVFDTEIINSPDDIYKLAESFETKGYKKIIVKSW